MSQLIKSLDNSRNYNLFYLLSKLLCFVEVYGVVELRRELENPFLRTVSTLALEKVPINSFERNPLEYSGFATFYETLSWFLVVSCGEIT